MSSNTIIFSDVDGTLVGDDHHALPQSEPIMRAVTAQLPLCLVSARSPSGLYPIQRDLGFVGPLACYSGAYVIDEKGDALFSVTIPLEVAVQIKQEVNAEFPGVCVGTYGFDTWVVDDREDPRVRNEEKLVQTTSRQCADLSEAFGDKGVHKLLLMGDTKDIVRAESILSARYPELNVVRSSTTLCEIMSRDASKSNAVRVLCEHFHTTPAQAVAFGDGPNDKDMLEAVGTSYAMANAEESVKAAATHVLAWTNQECGVARALEELFLK